MEEIMKFIKSIFVLGLALFLYSGALGSVTSNYAVTQTVHTDYSGTPVTSGAFVTIIASTSRVSNYIDVFDCSGYDFYLGVFQSDCITAISVPWLVQPGGNAQAISIPQGACVRIKAQSTTLASCYQDLNLYQ